MYTTIVQHQETASNFIRPSSDSYNLQLRKFHASVLLHRQYLLQRTILGYGLHVRHVGMFDTGQATRRSYLHSNQYKPCRTKRRQLTVQYRIM
jgi:hypothetical protein